MTKFNLRDNKTYVYVHEVEVETMQDAIDHFITLDLDTEKTYAIIDTSERAGDPNMMLSFEGGEWQWGWEVVQRFGW